MARAAELARVTREKLAAAPAPLAQAARQAGIAMNDAAAAAILEPSAFEIARAGGRNDGLYRRFQNARRQEIEKSIRSYQKRIAEHEAKIADPDAHLRADCTERHRRDLIERYWPDEIADYLEQIAVMRGILAERANDE
jgi:hypothetical protein